MNAAIPYDDVIVCVHDAVGEGNVALGRRRHEVCVNGSSERVVPAYFHCSVLFDQL